MIRIFFVLSFLFVSGISAVEGLASDNAFDSSRVSQDLQLFFDALKSGDVNALKTHIGGEVLQRRKSLIEKNKGYSKSLRNQFQAAKFQILDIEAQGKNVSSKVRVIFKSGSEQYIRFLLEKRIDPGSQQERWIVIKEDLD